MATKQLPQISVEETQLYRSRYWKEQKEYWYPLLYQNKRNEYLAIFDDKIARLLKVIMTRV